MHAFNPAFNSAVYSEHCGYFTLKLNTSSSGETRAGFYCETVTGIFFTKLCADSDHLVKCICKKKDSYFLNYHAQQNSRTCGIKPHLLLPTKAINLK